MPRRNESDVFLTPSEAADLLGVTPDELDGVTRREKLRPIRTLAGQRFRRSEIVALRARRRPPEPEPLPPPEPPARELSFGEQRGRSRRRALELLHAADIAGGDPRAGLRADDDPFVRVLVDGVSADREQLDTIIGGVAAHWTIERMPAVDRNLLRIAVWELLHTDTATGVVVDQAVGLAKLLSTEESGRFVNGVLGRIAREHRG